MKEKIEKNKKSNLRKICKLNPSSDSIPLNDDGSILFYMYDAYEEICGKGEPLVILFGKIYNKHLNNFQSISVVMKTLFKKIYILPKLDKRREPDIMSNLKSEFEKLNQTKFSFIKKGKYKIIRNKRYCLELPIPHGKIIRKIRGI